MISGIVVATFVLAFGTGYVIKFLSRRRPSRFRQIAMLLATTAKLSIFIVGVLMAVGTAGVDTRPIIAALGLTGFALGFALKDAISNLLAGVMIVIYSPFDIGDDIEIMGSRGRVVSTNLRYTELDADGVIHMIPNSSCFTNKIIRYAKPETSDADKKE